MKKQLGIAALTLGFTATAFAQQPAPAAETATEEKAPALSAEEIAQRSSYGLGFQSALQFANAGLTSADFNKDAFFQGFDEALNGGELKFSQEELEQAMVALQQQLMARDLKVGEENLKKEAAFLEENKKKDGIITTESGLQYQIIEKGGDKKYEAPKDAPNGMDMQSEFKLHYKGTLTDGTVFDQSPEGEPVKFTLQVVPGFAEALKTMPVGAKWKVFIPSKLGYGPRRMGAKLAPNSTLIFDIELLEIGKREMPQGMPFAMPGGAAPHGQPAK